MLDDPLVHGLAIYAMIFIGALIIFLIGAWLTSN